MVFDLTCTTGSEVGKKRNSVKAQRDAFSSKNDFTFCCDGFFNFLVL